jgi:tetratricopeptide (TPR) repeat protein
MTAYYGKRERRVIPRWRSSRATLSTPESVPLDAKLPSVTWSRDLLDKLTYEWRDNKKLFVATDLLGVAYTLREKAHPQALEAARFILKQGHHAPSVAVQIAQEYLEDFKAKQQESDADVVQRPREVIERIRLLKNRLRLEPRNAIARVDLSRYYASIGQKDRAAEEMRIALALARNHRFILRAAARLLVHLDKPDEAHRILRRNPLSKYDPWLAAAEIAVASVAKRPASLVKTGQDMLKSKKFAPAHTSELASAIGTLELEHGNAKLARKLFQQALVDPNDNAVAQAEWAAEQLGKNLNIEEHLSVPYSFEARALEAYIESKFADALKNSRLWFADEPFSSRPAILGSFVAAVGLEDYEASAEVARQGLKANPNDLVLRNNLVYALANSGRLRDAIVEYARFKEANPADVARVLFLATGGLLEFRQGHLEEGRRLYREALAEAKRIGQPRLSGSAALFYAVEEATAGTDRVIPALEAAEALLSKEPLPGQAVVLEKVRKAVAKRSSSKPRVTSK